MYVRDSMKQLVIFAALLLLLMMTSTVVFQSRSLYAYVRIDIGDILQQQDSQVSQCIYCSSLSCTVPFTASFLGPGWGVLRYLNVPAVLIRSYCRTPAFYYDWWWLPPPPPPLKVTLVRCCCCRTWTDESRVHAVMLHHSHPECYFFLIITRPTKHKGGL